MKLTMLGTGNSGMIPVYGCQCRICQAAHNDPSLRREKSSAYIEKNGKILLMDANAPDLMHRFPSGTIDCILLTHYHMDHVHSLFDLRWGLGEKIPVISPDDPVGCDDLYKHPGLLDFSTKAKPFVSFTWQGITITPLPLQHSKLCLGYVFEWEAKRVAYLTDTNGLPAETQMWLQQHPVDWLITDCNYPPIDDPKIRAQKNHNDFNQVLAIDKACQPKNIGLIHLSHQMLEWAKHHPQAFSSRLRLLDDGEVV